jgi:hypothetical protein
MRNRFNVDSDEKQRIISLHENSLKKNYLNLIVEQEQPTWLTFPNDKNYTYQKQNNKWVAKNKAGKVFDMSKYPDSVKKLETQFPGGKAPVNQTVNPQLGGVSSTDNTQTNNVSGVSSTATTDNTQTNNVSGGEGKVSELTGTRIFDNTKMEQPTTTSVNALVPFKIEGFTNNTTTPITIKLWKGDTDLVTSDLKVPMTLQPKQSTGPFQVFIKVVDLDKTGDGWSPNQSVHSELDVAGPLRMKAKFLGYDIFGKLNLYGNDNTFITLKFKRTILVKN